MQITETALPGVLLIEPRVFGDARGFFLESWNAKAFRDAGLDLDFVQDNHSRSARGVLRGIHVQANLPQGKLVRVIRGAVWDVAVDLRPGSPHFGQSVGYELTGDNHRMLWVPEGFGHGFLVLQDDTDFVYKCTQLYLPEYDRAVRWDDAELAIDWPVEGLEVQQSAKDAAAPTLAASGFVR